jgi:hypothetical protein
MTATVATPSSVMKGDNCDLPEENEIIEPATKIPAGVA